MTQEHTQKEQKFQLTVIAGIIIFLFLILIGKLFYMQVANDTNYSSLADNNRIRMVSTTAARGLIYDRNGEILATSTPVFAVALSIDGMTNDERKTIAESLSKVINDKELTSEVILKKIQEHSRTFEPVIITRIPYEEGLPLITKLEEMCSDLPGIVILEEPQRFYPQGALAGHLIGYVGLISENEVDMAKENGYLLTDWIGKSGLEKVMERFTVDGKEIGLRGMRGVTQMEVDSRHNPVETLSVTEPRAGNSLVLTIDASVQRVMESKMEEIIKSVSKTQSKCDAGAAVLIDVKTGGILAMASYPTLNPNDFVAGFSDEDVEYYYQNDALPLFNRAISGTYAPGSTFKPATALAIMVSDKIDPKETVNCTAAAWKKPRSKCTKQHGPVNLYEAIAYSCNTYFQEMAYRIGEEQLISVCKQLGFGKVTGINLLGEDAGFLPSPEWKAENFTGWEEVWRNYDTFFMSMGQGYNLETPIQLANYIATIANGGTRFVPRVIDKILDNTGQEIYTCKPQIAEVLDNIDPQDFATVRAAMLEGTHAGGTAYWIFNGFPIKVGTKTGTAQTGIVGDDPKKDFNGVFVAFAPYDNPEVAFACVIEHGQAGGTTGGRVARAVFEEYFGLNAEPLPDELPEAVE